MTVYAWGDDFWGQLGTGKRENVEATPISTLPGWNPAAVLMACAGHSLAWFPDGLIEGVGSNEYGSIGDGTKTQPTFTPTVSLCPPARLFDSGRSHSLAVGYDTHPRTWGGNLDGQLGVGTAPKAGERENIAGLPACTATPQILPALGKLALVACGDVNCYTLDTAGNLYAWGANQHGQIGDGTSRTERYKPTLAKRPPAPVVALAAGLGHVLALLNDSTVASWGAGGKHQLGYGVLDQHTPARIPGLTGVKAIAAGGDHSVFLLDDGTVRECGEGHPVRAVPFPAPVTAVAGGYQHNLAIAGGVVYGWGQNEYGQVGDGTRTAKPTPVSTGVKASQITAGELHSLAR